MIGRVSKKKKEKKPLELSSGRLILSKYHRQLKPEFSATKQSINQ